MIIRPPAPAEGDCTAVPPTGARRFPLSLLLSGCGAAALVAGVLLVAHERATVAAPPGKSGAVRKRILEAFGEIGRAHV